MKQDEMQNRILSRLSVCTLFREIHKSQGETLLVGRRRIGYLYSANLSRRRSGMGLCIRLRIDIYDIDTADDKSITDERAMAAPWDCFSAHDDGELLLRQFDEPDQCRSKLGVCM